MTPEEPVTVVVADDQSAVREGLVLLLGTLPGITVAGEAADGDAAVQLVATVQPQVVLMDLNMPGISGVEATRQISMVAPLTRVLVLTISDQEKRTVEVVAGALDDELRARGLGRLTDDLGGLVGDDEQWAMAHHHATPTPVRLPAFACRRGTARDAGLPFATGSFRRWSITRL